MTRMEGTWSYRYKGVELHAESLDALVSAIAELGIAPKAQKKVQELEKAMNEVQGGSEEWITLKIKRDVWEEVARV